jgi:transposase
MGKAVSYALTQWDSLEVYLHEPGIEIDNNLVENAIRPNALGKNYEQSGIRQSLTPAMRDFRRRALDMANHATPLYSHN